MLFRLFVILLFLLLFPGAGLTEEAPVSQAGELTLEQLQSLRAQAEQDKELSEEDRKALLGFYDEAQGWLKKASQYRDRAEAFVRARSEAPREADRIRKELAERQKKPVAGPDLKRLRRKSLGELSQLVETHKADLLAKEAALGKLEQEPLLQPGRPDAARARLVQAKQELDGLRQKLQSPLTSTAPLDRAQRLRDRARLEALQQEVKMLEQELLSLPARQALHEVQLQQARLQLKEAKARLEALVQLVNERRKAEVVQLSRTQEKAAQDLAQSNPVLKKLADENARLSDRLARITEALGRTATLDSSLRDRTNRIRGTFRATREKVEVAGLKGVLGQVLLEQRQQLPDMRELRRQIAEVRQRITEVSLEQIRLREELARLQESGLQPKWPASIPPEQRKGLQPELKRLEKRRLELLQKLVDTQEDYIRSLADQDAALKELLHAVEEFDDYLAEHLLWVRNTRAFRLSDLQALGGELRQLLQPEGWLQAWRALGEQVVSSPKALLALLALLLFAVLHGHWKRAIRATGIRAGKPGQGNLPGTLKALALSLLVALWPLLWLSFLYWQFRQLGDRSLHAHAMAQALYWIMAPFYSLLLGLVLSMKGGLLQAHFRWREENLRKLRRALAHLFWFFIPASAFTAVASQLLPDGLGSVVVKLAFVVLALSLNFFIYRVFHPTRGLVASYLQQNPRGYASRLRWVWFSVITGIPLVLLVLSLMGYVYTGATILRYLMNTLWLIAGLVVVQQLAEFWLLLTRRRIAYQAALARRKAMQEAQEKEQQGEEGGPPPGEREEAHREEEEKVDLVALSRESRRLLNALLFIGGAIGLWLIWAPLFPALTLLDDIALWHHTVVIGGKSEMVAVTLGDVLSVVAIVLLTVLAARNLPSLVEILLLQYLDISAGSRYTIRTLSGYLIAAVGMVAVFKAVGGSWAEIQWLVAALGVGIGFGLQEIVANFISGLIILFERPIRVGDFVTVGDTDGTVTRIRIRATTILTRDRKELLVPNKEFITGRLLNWTLSDQTTRLKLVVGIAYGSDVRLAEKIMLEAAREHPRVLKEPAPWVNFDDFGDSALLLELRCIIDSADHRVRVLSELRHAIDQGFRAAEIQIPFPQRDVHMDTGEPLEVKVVTS